MKYALWLSNIPGLTNVRIRYLMEVCENAKEVYGLSESALSKIYGIEEEHISAIAESRRRWNLEEQMERLEQQGISFVSQEQREYPGKLRNISDAPYSLYYRGTLPVQEKKSVAIVGARGRSEYGSSVARRLAASLAGNQISIVSGMARGIDADGHLGAISGEGLTYAVLGCGVDVCYPASNRFLYDKILQSGGGILSEYPPGTQPLARFFPQRNRIISGLSDCVVVIEARKKSGSLITADYAMEQGRDVYALPGRITDPLSQGCNQLIRQGAGILTDVNEFMEELHIMEGAECTKMDFRKNLLEKDEGLVYSLLDFCPMGLGTLTEKTKLPLSSLLDIMKRLEEKGFIREPLPNYYIRCI